MSRVLIAALCLTLAAPVIVTVAPTSAEAQVMAGRGASRAAARRNRPALSDREETRLYDAQDQVIAIDQQIYEIQTAAEAAGGLTPEQQASIQQHEARKADHQSVIDRLEAKRERRST